MLELLQYVSHPEPKPEHAKGMLRSVGHAHFALTVKSLDTVYASFTKMGIDFINPPRISQSGKAKVAFCRDPEGNFIELVEVIG